MIFQEPMTSLNPVLTIGFQIAEALILHRGMSRSRRRKTEVVRLLDKVRIPGRELAHVFRTIRIASPAACASA